MKHIVFCGAQGSGKTYQAQRLMALLFEKEEWRACTDSSELLVEDLVKSCDAVMIDKCKSAERIAWLSGLISGTALRLNKKFSAIFITQDIEGAALLDTGVFRVVECFTPAAGMANYTFKNL